MRIANDEIKRESLDAVLRRKCREMDARKGYAETYGANGGAGTAGHEMLAPRELPECVKCARSLCWRAVTWAVLACAGWCGVSVGFRVMRALWHTLGI